MPAYDGGRFSPPAPVALVTLQNPETGKEMSEVPMLIDSGADISMVPQRAVAELAVDASADQFEILGVEGLSTFAKVVWLELLFLGRKFRGEFLITESEYGILGRNILNRVPLLLDGPNLSWSEVRRQ